MIADLAMTLPVTFGSAEEVVALRPDVVLASFHTSAPARGAFERLGVQVEVFQIPNSIADSSVRNRAASATVWTCDLSHDYVSIKHRPEDERRGEEGRRRRHDRHAGLVVRLPPGLGLADDPGEGGSEDGDQVRADGING